MTVVGLSLLNPFGWFGPSRAKLSGGQDPGQSSAGVYDSNAAGKPVTPQTALSLATYWACVKLIAQTIGTLPLEVYNVAPSGSRAQALDNPLYDLLHDQPNAESTAVEFWEGVAACLAVWGNSYVLKQTIAGRLVALDLLRPDWMTVFRAADGTPVYRYLDPQKGRTDYAVEDLMHVRGFGFGDIVGLSPITFNRQSIGTALAVDEAAGSTFRNGMRASGFFKYKGATGFLSPEQTDQVKKRLVEPYQGSQNTGRTGILPGDFDWVSTSMNPVDAELLNNRRLNVEEICRAFGVPPVMVGHIGQGQTMWGTGVEHIVLGFMTTGLRPYLRRIEAAIDRDLIGRANRRTLRATFNFEELLRGDNKGMAEVDQSMANTGIMTRNELRARRGLPAKPGGDTLTVQSALLPIDMLGKVSKLPKDKPVAPGADVDGGGPTGRPPFEGKAFDAGRHPRDAAGRFSGRGAGKGRVGRLVRRALADRHHKDVVDLGAVDATKFTHPAVSSMDGWRHALTADAVRHIRDNHGNAEVERRRGQTAISADDIGRVQDVLRSAPASAIQPGGLTKGLRLPTLVIDHPVGGHQVHLVLEVRKGRRALSVHTLRKRPLQGKSSDAAMPYAGKAGLGHRPKRTAAPDNDHSRRSAGALQESSDMHLFIAPSEFKLAADGAAELGTFSGYAAVFGNVDSHGDVIAPGAFKSTLERRGLEGRGHVPMHVQHAFLGGDGLPIGVWKTVAEDDKGLKVEGKISGMNTDAGRMHYERLKDGAYGGLSIGFNTTKATSLKGSETGKRLVEAVDLKEISLVTDPSNAKAIIEVKTREAAEFKGVTNHSKAVASIAAAMAAHRAAHNNPTAEQSGTIFGHLQDCHEALTGDRMPDGMKALPSSKAEIKAMFLDMGIPADRAELLAAGAFGVGRNEPSGETKTAITELSGLLSGFALPTFG